MGSADGKAPEKPVHEVWISRGFWLGKHEVTQEEYESVMGKNPSKFRGARNPVEQVFWNDAMAFCGKLTKRELTAGRVPTLSGKVFLSAEFTPHLPVSASWRDDSPRFSLLLSRRPRPNNPPAPAVSKTNRLLLSLSSF